MPTLVSKADFARRVGVTDGRVSKWIAVGDLAPPALVMDGRRERIDLDEAHRQLGDRVLVDQRLVKPAARARARCPASLPRDHEVADGRGTTLNAIASEKLSALQLANAKARAEAAALAGRFVEAEGVRTELGLAAARLIAVFEAALPELAEAVAHRGRDGVDPVFERDALHAMRGAWRGIRARLAGAEAEAASVLPELVEATA